MPIRAEQIIFDEPLDFNNVALNNVQLVSFAAQTNGTIPGARELIYADGKFKVQNLEVYNRLQAGETNASVFADKALVVETDTRNWHHTFDGFNRMNVAQERDNLAVKRSMTPVYDALNRITSLTEVTSEGSFTTNFTYAGTNEQYSDTTKVQN